MSVLHDKHILLGISGSIAAYKTPLIVRLLVKAGAAVQVVMTESAKTFVTPLTLSTVSNREVLSSFINEENENAVWNNHVDLGLWADAMLIAPASANTLSKMSQANADNLLIATYLSAKCPVFFAPAMDLDMHKHPANKSNIEKLIDNGNILIPATSGALASGLEGEGRMEEPEQIIAALETYFLEKSPFFEKKIVITAGPTYEPIDPVRFIGNHSSGKMGYALANCAAQLGANVTLISGPTAGNKTHPNVDVLGVTTAEEMLKACIDMYDGADAVIMSAAVADFKPSTKANQKLKKRDGLDVISLTPTTDILAHLGKKKKHQVLIGFALESENAMAHAQDKMIRKNLDAIVVNSLTDTGAGFGHDTNKITFLQRDKAPVNYSLKSKEEVAKDVLFHLKNIFDAQ
ncbi:MAG: bifunctional phosphopantothenoylcysteine decarboxylase/phosphopantothenate--cysteine ligase CoaBC [Bacteroidetes bacterium]|nr:bifunctional phosphopantothenoylcysteine decarboxylase/phosphopantothenate--cysteine ligase CoaBC [Bacteroidota bacterium]MDA0888430.1 bifunctional phosphopantothenoylcysteine decarboxylase/phosphopantothenate--cysteine ligase CoaBC [Bacteroidota bacterium]MDA1084490.1 bifunctional phosphopantothenoylcysteine decarboxylase/phosphopantothenate--cysteine ligase CoaBC [Bacteroidota bacterium]